MIKEAYVSFEVAKLLKEKGFNEYCLKNYWSSDKELHDWKWELSYNRNSDGNSNTKDCSAPTHQMAMAWLREIHNIFINIDVIPYTTVTIEQRYYFYKIYRNRRLINFSPQIEDIQFYNTPEEAVEASLKYVLENLI